MASPLIIHVDMDAFYASVEVLDNPELADKCVIVGGTGNRGVVCAASYQARKLGVRSAQPVVKARQLCPHGVYLPVRRDRYSEISKQVFQIFHRFTPLVEPLSIDEAFLDVTASTQLFGDAKQIGESIRHTILKEVGLTASAGVGENKLTAKIASEMCKPDGLMVVKPEDTLSFLHPLPISRLWGAGPAVVKKLGLLGVQNIGDATRLSRDVLSDNFGKYGDTIYNFSRGRDSRPVEPPSAVKSVGNEITFDENVVNIETVHKKFLYIAEKVARRLRRGEVCGRTISIKVKYYDFKQVTRSATIETPTDDAGIIYDNAKSLAEKTMAGEKAVRLLGITVSSLAGPGQAWQPGLFDNQEEIDRRKNLHKAIDGISDKFGEAAVGPASLMPD